MTYVISNLDERKQNRQQVTCWFFWYSSEIKKEMRGIRALKAIAANAPAQSAPRDRLHATVSAALEARILGGDLKIGDKLESESAIAKEFGVSTRAVREAIQTLETKGLVMRRHGDRTTVVDSAHETDGSDTPWVEQPAPSRPIVVSSAVRKWWKTSTTSWGMSKSVIAPHLPSDERI